MRSEKEIKEKIDWFERQQNYPIYLNEKTLEECLGEDENSHYFNDYDHAGTEELALVLRWLLEGEPRYSVEELEKIMLELTGDLAAIDGEKKYVFLLEDFVKFMKQNPAKVKEILEAKS